MELQKIEKKCEKKMVEFLVMRWKSGRRLCWKRRREPVLTINRRSWYGYEEDCLLGTEGARKGGKKDQQTKATYRLCELDAIQGEIFTLEGLEFDQHHDVRRCCGWEGMRLRGLSGLGPDEQTPPTEERDRYHARVLEKLRHKVGVRDTQGGRGCGNAGDSRNGTTIACFSSSPSFRPLPPH